MKRPARQLRWVWPRRITASLFLALLILGAPPSVAERRAESFHDSSLVIGSLTATTWFDAIPFSPDLPAKYDKSRGPTDQGLFYKGTQNTLPLQIFDIDYNNVGGFIQDRTVWNDSLTTTAGIRIDSNSDYGTTVNPRVGVVWEARDSTTVSASLRRTLCPLRRPSVSTAGDTATRMRRPEVNTSTVSSGNRQRNTP